MAEVDKENKITFEELSPSLQSLFKNAVSQEDYSDLVDKLDKISENLANLTDDFVKKTKVWEAFHKLADNTNPGTSDSDWNSEGMYITTYNKPTITNQPSNSGQLINIPCDKDINYSTQLFISQPDGSLYIRASNGNINNTQFKRIMTSDDVSGVPAIGRIILYAYNVNPTTEYPGTKWIRIGDCYLKSGTPGVGQVNIKNSSTDATSKTGSTTIKLSEANLPAHSHNGSTTNTTGSHHHDSGFGEAPSIDGCRYGYYDSTTNNRGSGDSDWDNMKWNTSTDGAHSHTIASTSSPNCKGTAIDNTPYAAVVAAWYRIS